MRFPVKARRIIADLIDWNLIFVLGSAFLFLGPNFDPIFLLYPSVEMFSAYGVLLSLFTFLVLPFFKDCLFRSVSLGKALMGLKIVDGITFEKAKISKLLLRNLTFYFFFIELLLLLIHGETIADLLTKTTVCSRNSAKG